MVARSLFIACSLMTIAHAEITARTVEYQLKDNKTTFQGYLVGDMTAGPKPGVLLIHQWGGITDYEKRRAQQIAELGYTVFCADVYGKGIRPTDPAERGKQAGMYKNDRPKLRMHLQAALDELTRWPMTDKTKVAAIGYCFGGTAALELARSGADLKGVISFHGGLDSPTPADAAQIKGEVLVLHGADDPLVPKAEIEGFHKEMKDAEVKYQFIEYAGAVHSFTQKEAGNDPSRGSAYNAEADEKSFAEMVKFFTRIFR